MTSTAVRYVLLFLAIINIIFVKHLVFTFRVGLRVRPLTQKEELSNCTECISFIPNEPQILIGADKSFTYDYVFSSDSDQTQVYETAAVPLLEKFIEG